jgi:hypothetical protein
MFVRKISGKRLQRYSFIGYELHMGKKWRYQQQLLPESQLQAGSVPRIKPLIIPAAQPTPDFTVMASA